MTQTFEDAVDWSSTGPQTREQTLESEWFQGPGAFGGIVAASVVRAFDADLDADDYRIRSLNLEFLAPVDGRPAELTVDVLRRGRSVVNAEARIEQDGELAVTARAALCRDRDSGVVVDEVEPPNVSDPDELEAAPHNPLFPNFARHYEHRFCIGSAPFSGAGEAVVGGWGRLKGADQPADAAHVVALIDIWPPAVLSTVSEPMGAATISWQIVFDEPLPVDDAGPDDFYLGAVETRRASAGYASERARLYDRNGRRLAEALQWLTIFE